MRPHIISSLLDPKVACSCTWGKVLRTTFISGWFSRMKNSRNRLNRSESSYGWAISKIFTIVSTQTVNVNKWATPTKCSAVPDRKCCKWRLRRWTKCQRRLCLACAMLRSCHRIGRSTPDSPATENVTSLQYWLFLLLTRLLFRIGKMVEENGQQSYVFYFVRMTKFGQNESNWSTGTPEKLIEK